VVIPEPHRIGVGEGVVVGVGVLIINKQQNQLCIQTNLSVPRSSHH
jgi:hypothetical protein